MSFASDVKEELSRLEGHERHCRIAELSAIIRLCGKVHTDTSGQGSILLHTENVAVARRFYILMKSSFDIQPEVAVRRHQYLKKNRYYIISIQGDNFAAAGLADLLALLGLDAEDFKEV